MACPGPSSQIFSVAWRNLMPRHQEQITGMDTLLSQDCQGIGVAGLHPKRRMGFLHRLQGKRHVLILMKRPFEAQRSFGGKGFFDKRQGLIRQVSAIFEISAIGSKKVRHNSRHQTKLQAPVQYVVQDPGILGDWQGVVKRSDETHWAMPHLARVPNRAGAIDGRRGHPTFVGIEVMLNGETKVETELVAGFELAPQLFVSLRHGHARLVPHMREVREFHLTPPNIRQSPNILLQRTYSKYPALSLWLTPIVRRRKKFDAIHRPT